MKIFSAMSFFYPSPESARNRLQALITGERSRPRGMDFRPLPGILFLQAPSSRLNAAFIRPIVSMVAASGAFFCDNLGRFFVQTLPFTHYIRHVEFRKRLLVRTRPILEQIIKNYRGQQDIRRGKLKSSYFRQFACVLRLDTALS